MWGDQPEGGQVRRTDKRIGIMASIASGMQLGVNGEAPNVERIALLKSFKCFCAGLGVWELIHGKWVGIIW